MDDLLVTGSTVAFIEEFKQNMMKIFEMTNCGEMAFFLGMEIKQDEKGVFISQKKYAKEILKKFHIENCKPICTLMFQKLKLCKEDGAEKVDETGYKSLVCCLMYLTATRPDILQTISVLSRFLHCASEVHFQAANHVIRYVKCTLGYGVWFKHNQEFNLHGFFDSDQGGSLNDMKSSLGYCCTFGS